MKQRDDIQVLNQFRRNDQKSIVELQKEIAELKFQQENTNTQLAVVWIVVSIYLLLKVIL